MDLAEPASSLTDFALGIVAIIAAVRLWKTDGISAHWSRVFATIGIAGLMGGIHHGFFESHPTLATVSWSAIMLVIAISITFLLAATIVTVLGDSRSQLVLWIWRTCLVDFLILTLLGHATVSTLVITEGVVMIAVVLLCVHVWRLTQPGAGLILVDVGASIIAAAIQGSSLHFTFAGWKFGPDALYHLAQMPGLVLLHVAVKSRARAIDLRPSH